MFELSPVLIFFGGFFTGYFARPTIEAIVREIALCMNHR